MTPESTIALFSAVLIFGLSPGPAIAAIVARAMSSGFRNALALSAGIILGDMVYLLFAMLGLANIARSMGEFFIVVKIVGGIYLIYIGWKVWIQKLSADRTEEESNGEKNSAEAFLAGLSITLSNPKVIVFYLSFLPAFINLEALNFAGGAITVSTVGLTLLLVNAMYAYAASRGRKLLKSATAVRNVNRGSGAVMMVAGVYVAVRS